jgi:hypothetical protein
MSDELLVVIIVVVIYFSSFLFFSFLLRSYYRIDRRQSHFRLSTLIYMTWTIVSRLVIEMICFRMISSERQTIWNQQSHWSSTSKSTSSFVIYISTIIFLDLKSMQIKVCWHWTFRERSCLCYCLIIDVTLYGKNTSLSDRKLKIISH